MKHILFHAVLTVGLSISVLHASWPQWRGTYRNGVAQDSPALTTEFPDKIPTILWESFEIPSDDDGGHSSIVVENGHAYLSLVWHRHVPATERTIDSRVLRKLGHRSTKMPAEKIAAMEEARINLPLRLRGSKLEEWIDQWIKEKLSEEEKLHYEGYVKGRLKQGKLALPIQVLDTVASKRDQPFPNQASLDKWVGKQGWTKDINEKVLDAIPGTKRVSRDTVLCLDAKTGKEVWRFESPTEPVNRSASSTPCIAAGRVYSVCGSIAYCLDSMTGQLIWKSPIISKGPASSPMMVEGKLILLDNTLKALDAKSGKLLWEQKAVKGNRTSPATWGTAKSLTILCQSSNEFIGVDGNTGKIRWQVNGGGDASAAVSGNYVAIQHKHSDSGLVVYNLTEDGIKKTWEYLYTSRRYSSSPILHDGRVYLLGASRHLCADIKTGEIRWNKPAKSEIASPILADGKLFVMENNGGLLTILDASANEYKELASIKVGAIRCPSPAIDDGLLYLRRANSICCFDFRKK